MAKMTYGEMIQRLEEIVSVLESGTATLEDSLTLFQEAGGLIAQCNAVLSDARLKVSQITTTSGENNG